MPHKWLRDWCVCRCTGCAGKTEIPWERVPYLSDLEVWSRQGAIQIHVYHYLDLYARGSTHREPRVLYLTKQTRNIHWTFHSWLIATETVSSVVNASATLVKNLTARYTCICFEMIIRRSLVCDKYINLLLLLEVISDARWSIKYSKTLNFGHP